MGDLDDRPVAAYGFGQPAPDPIEAEPHGDPEHDDPGGGRERGDLVLQRPTEHPRIGKTEDPEESQHQPDEHGDEGEIAEQPRVRPERLPGSCQHHDHHGHGTDVREPPHRDGKRLRQERAHEVEQPERRDDGAEAGVEEAHRRDAGRQQQRRARGPNRAGSHAEAEQQMRSGRDDRQRDDDRCEQREGLRIGQRLEQFALGGLHREDRQEAHDGREHRGEHGAAHFTTGTEHDLAGVLVRPGIFEPPQDVLTEHDAHVDDRADGNGDPGQRDDVRVHAEHFHPDERHEHRHRQHHADQQAAPQVHEHQDDDRDRHEHLLGDRCVERSERLVDQAGPVIERHDGNATLGPVGEGLCRQPPLDLLDPLLDTPDDRQRVRAVSDDNHAPHRLGPALGERAAPQCRAEMHRGDVPQQDGVAVSRRHGGLLEILDAVE